VNIEPWRTRTVSSAVSGSSFKKGKPVPR